MLGRALLRRVAPAWAGALACLAPATLPGQAENFSNPAAAPPSSPFGQNEDFSGSPLGSLGGLRPWLVKRGITLSGIYTGEVVGNVRGGLRRGVVAEGLLELDVDADLAKLAGWTGASLHAGAFWIHGASPSQKLVGDLGVLSSIDAYDTVRLAEWWFQQNLFGDKLSLKAGQFFIDNEFAYTNYGNLFATSSFGAFSLFGLNYPFPSTYPIAAPAVRLLYQPTPEWLFRVAAFAGSTLAEDRNTTSFPRFSARDGALFLGEATWRLHPPEKSSGLHGTYKLGVIFHSHYAGQLNANPDSLDRSIWSVYVAADQQVWRRLREHGTKQAGGKAPSLGVFVRLGVAPRDVAFVHRYAEGGFNYNGLIAGRNEDVLGLGVTHSEFSPTARRASVLGGGPAWRRETQVELTYRVALKDWWTLQPSLRYIVNPGGTGARDAVVLALRTTAVF